MATNICPNCGNIMRIFFYNSDNNIVSRICDYCNCVREDGFIYSDVEELIALKRNEDYYEE
jgi:hypothetical protein